MAGSHKLILEIEVPEFYVDGSTQEAADEWYKGDILPIVTEEWMRAAVGLTIVSMPGEKSQITCWGCGSVEVCANCLDDLDGCSVCQPAVNAVESGRE